MKTSYTQADTRKSVSWSNLSLGTKLVSILLLVAIVPLLIIAYINDRNSRDNLTHEANARLSSAASLVSTQIDTFVTSNLDVVRSEAQSPAVTEYLALPTNQRAGSPEERRLNDLFVSIARQDPVYLNSIALLDKQGITLADTNSSSIRQDRSNRYYYQQVIKTDLPFASTLEYDITTGRPSLYFAAPVHDSLGNIIGVYRKRFNANILQGFVANSTGLAGEQSFGVVVDENHVRIAHGTNRSIIYKSIVPFDAVTLTKLQEERFMPPGTVEELSTNIPGFKEGLNDYKNNPYFAAQLTIGDETLEQVAVVRSNTQPWLIVFAQPQAVFLEPINTQAQNNIYTVAFISLVVAIFGVAVSRTISGPITRLTQTAAAISSGDINVQAKVETGDEIGALAGTFNRMTAQLRDFIATLEQRVADRTKALATTSEVSRRLSTILDRNELVSEVVEQVKKSFDYYHAHIYFYDENKGELVMAGGTGDAGRTMLAQGHRIPHGRGLVGRAAESNTPVLVSDTSTDSNWLPNPLLPDTKSEVAIPISIGTDVLGVLDVQHNITDGLKREDVDSLQSIANQVAIAMQNIRQYENARKIANDLGVVADVGIATATITEIDRLLQEVVDLSKKSFNLYHVHIYMLDEDGDNLMLAAGAGEVGRHMVQEGRSIPLHSEKSLVARAARSREGVVVNNVTTDPDFLPNTLLPNTRAEMAVPMMVAGNVIGVLDVQSDMVNRFTETDVNIKTTLASQIAVAVQNARSFMETQHQAERETLLNAINQKIQSAQTIEAALQTAARELGHALGMKPTLVLLDPSALAGENKAS